MSRYRKVAASSLVINDVQEIDDGSYQCRAENEVETLDAAADLIVQGILLCTCTKSFYLQILEVFSFNFSTAQIYEKAGR